MGGDTRTQIIFIILLISYYNYSNTVLSEFLCFRGNTLSDTIFRFSLITSNMIRTAVLLSLLLLK